MPTGLLPCRLAFGTERTILSGPTQWALVQTSKTFVTSLVLAWKSGPMATYTVRITGVFKTYTAFFLW